MKRVVALMLLSMFSVALLAGCNTVAGAGKDVQKAEIGRASCRERV